MWKRKLPIKIPVMQSFLTFLFVWQWFSLADADSGIIIVRGFFFYVPVFMFSFYWGTDSSGHGFTYCDSGSVQTAWQLRDKAC